MTQYFFNCKFPILVVLFILEININVIAQEKTIVLKNEEVHIASFVSVKDGFFRYSDSQFSENMRLPVDDLVCYYIPDYQYVWVPIENDLLNLVATGSIFVLYKIDAISMLVIMTTI